jgi:hypothetical protein
MPVPANLVHQQSITTGSSNLTLTKVNGKNDFATAFTTGGANVFDYFISNQDAAEWERGTGSMDTTAVMIRGTVIQTHAGTTDPINFSAGTKDVTNDVPAALQVRTLSTVASTGLFAVFDSTQGNLIKVAATPPLTSLTSGPGITVSGSTISISLTSGDGITVSGSTISAEAATTNNSGIMEVAEDSEYRANTAGSLALTPAKVWSAAGAVALSTATTAVAVDMGTLLTVATLSISTPMTLANPTNTKVGQHFIVAAQVSGSTIQTLSLGTAYKRWTLAEAPPYSIAASGAEKLYVCGFVETSTGIIVTSVGRTTAVT